MQFPGIMDQSYYKLVFSEKFKLLLRGSVAHDIERTYPIAYVGYQKYDTPQGFIKGMIRKPRRKRQGKIPKEHPLGFTAESSLSRAQLQIVWIPA
jgi:hypothetical protein